MQMLPIQSDQPDTNKNGVRCYYDPDALFHALVRWDMSSIPANATITSAALDFKFVGVGLYPPPAGMVGEIFYIYNVLQNWIVDQVTWNSYATGFSWSVPGATGALDVSSSIGSYAVPTNGNNRTITIDNSIAQGWMTNNTGILCRVPESVKRFAENAYLVSSANASAAGLRFYLTYALPGDKETVSVCFLK